MSIEQAKALSEFCKTVIYFLSVLGMGICLHKGRNREGRGPEKLLLLGLLTMGTGTFLSAYGVKLGLPESWGKILGDVVLVNAGTAVTILAVYLLTIKFHLVALALKKEAVTDPLTGLYNRRTFFRELDCRLEGGGGLAVAWERKRRGSPDDREPAGWGRGETVFYCRGAELPLEKTDSCGKGITAGTETVSTKKKK